MFSVSSCSFPVSEQDRFPGGASAMLYTAPRTPAIEPGLEVWLCIIYKRLWTRYFQCVCRDEAFVWQALFADLKWPLMFSEIFLKNPLSHLQLLFAVQSALFDTNSASCFAFLLFTWHMCFPSINFHSTENCFWREFSRDCAWLAAGSSFHSASSYILTGALRPVHVIIDISQMKALL